MEILLADGQSVFGGSGGYEILETWALPTQEHVVLRHTTALTPDSISATIADHRSREGTKLDGRPGWNADELEGRILIVGIHPQGFRSFLDVAASQE